MSLVVFNYNITIINSVLFAVKELLILDKIIVLICCDFLCCVCRDYRNRYDACHNITVHPHGRWH